MQETVKKFGRVDVLLNNAAIYVTQKLWKGPVEDLEFDEWDRVIEVNLKGVFLVQQGGDPDHEAAALGQDHQHRLGHFF